MLVIKKVKHTSPWTYVIEDLDGKQIIGMFYEHKQKKFRIEKVISCMWNGKIMIIYSIVELISQIIYYHIKYESEFSNVELDFF